MLFTLIMYKTYRRNNMADTVQKSQKATKIEVVSFRLNDNNQLESITVNANGTYTTLKA